MVWTACICPSAKRDPVTVSRTSTHGVTCTQAAWQPETERTEAQIPIPFDRRHLYPLHINTVDHNFFILTAITSRTLLNAAMPSAVCRSSFFEIEY